MQLTKYEKCILFIPNLGKTGGVRYSTSEHTAGVVDAASTGEITKWRTKRTVNDREEFDKARALQEKLRRRFAKCGTSIKAGVIVPQDKIDALNDAIEETRGDIRAFNMMSVYSRFWFYPVQITLTDENSNVMEAATRELIDLLALVSKRLEAGDFADVRKLFKGLNVGAYADLYRGDAQEKVKDAFKAIRRQCKQLAVQAKAFGDNFDELRSEVNLAVVDTARAALIELQAGSDAELEDMFEVIDVQSAAQIETGSTGSMFM